MNYLKDFVVHSKVSGGQISLKAPDRTKALLAASELLEEPLKNLAAYQPTEW